MSTDTLHLFQELLDQVSLPASHPDFDGQAARISRAKADLAKALADNGA